MAFGETKVYFDGSHYIAIPHTERPKRYRPKPVEEEITVVETVEDGSVADNAAELVSIEITGETDDTAMDVADTDKSKETKEMRIKNERKMTRKELFNRCGKRNAKLLYERLETDASMSNSRNYQRCAELQKKSCSL